jgi:anti-sigma factor RsiW
MTERANMRCTEADAFLHAYVDGELAGTDRDTYEQHLLDCDRCSRCSRLQARFKAAVRGHLPRREVPAALRRRIELAVASAPPPPGRWRWQLYPKLVPAVLAAGALAVIVLSSQGRPSMAVQTALRSYSAALPMDFVGTSCATVSDWFHGRVDFPVRPPAESIGARCEGGRLMPLGNQIAAYVILRTPSGHKLDVIVWPGDEDEESSAPLYRLRNGLDIHMANARGASSATFRNSDGLHYMITSDLDPSTLMQFLTVAFPR